MGTIVDLSFKATPKVPGWPSFSRRRHHHRGLAVFSLSYRRLIFPNIFINLKHKRFPKKEEGV